MRGQRGQGPRDPGGSDSRNDPPDDLRAALRACRKSARVGYRIAKSNLERVDQSVQRAVIDLDASLRRLGGSRLRNSDIMPSIREQYETVTRDLTQSYRHSAEDIAARKASLDVFSITLFGRTKAGKSTLMEILTNGDGTAIGKGAQRTTRDVRSYRWHGLQITDVPGVAAFEGAADERVAFEAAAASDLIIFLITDDAPQESEAECLAQVRSLGKPIIGVCNVKQNVRTQSSLRIFLRRPEDTFDLPRLHGLIDQFHELSNEYIPGDTTRFEYTHLDARFLAGRPEYRSHAADLRRLSRFDRVEQRITATVLDRGRFMRIKTFIDSSSVPMLALADRLLDFSATNSANGRTLVSKRRQFEAWLSEYEVTSHQRIDAFVTNVSQRLSADVADFAERNADRRDAGERWAQEVADLHIPDQADRLARQIQVELQDGMREVARELEAELSLVGRFEADRTITMGRIFDSKRAWRWTFTSVAGVIGITAVIIGSGPLGWAAAGVGLGGELISRFFSDRETKARKQRKQLQKKLVADIERMRSRLETELQRFLNQLLDKQGRPLLGDMDDVVASVFLLADTQRELAWRMNSHLLDLNQQLFDRALEDLHISIDKKAIRGIARIPGLAVMLLIEPGFQLPYPDRDRLESLLAERIWFVVDTRRPRSLIAQALGRDVQEGQVHVELKIRVAHVPVESLSKIGRSRVKLAQQLTELHVGP